MKELTAALETRMGPSVSHLLVVTEKASALGQLISEGKILKSPVQVGKQSRFRAADIDRVTLGDLLRLAESCVDPRLQLTAGRSQKLGEVREVETISPRQFTRIKTMANTLAAYLVPDAAASGASGEELWDRVDDESLWMQDPAAKGISAWSRIRSTVEKASTPKRLRDDLGAADLLLDLAATHGIIIRSRTTEDRRFVIPVAWLEVQERWIELVRDIRGHNLGVMELMRAASHVLGPDGDLDELKTEPVGRAVVERVRATLIAGTHYRPTQRTWIRNTLRRLVAAGELPKIEINAYDRRTENRLRAWNSSFDKAIAAAHKHDWENREAAWEGFPFAALGDPANPYSLRRIVDLMTAPNHARRKHGWPSPGFVARNRVRGKSLVKPRPWTKGTTRKNLGTLAYFIGMIRKLRPNADLQTLDLRHLLTSEYAQLVLQARERRILTDRTAWDILIYMGYFASPWMEWLALQEEDVEAADRFAEFAEEVTGKGPLVNGVRQPPLVKDLTDSTDEGRDSVEGMRAKAAEVQRVYEENLGVAFAYEGMVRVFEAARGRVLAVLGCSCFEELARRWDTADINRKRLVEIRNLALWNDLLAAPMRSRATLGQTMGMRHFKDGRLILDVDADLQKVPRNGRYRVTLCDGPGSAYDLDLWNLYAERVRPALLGPHSSDAVWVTDMSQNNATHPDLQAQSLLGAVRSVLGLAGPELGYKDDSAFNGARDVHAFRHAVGSYFVAHERHETARLLLHHKGLDLLLQVYANPNERVTTGDVRAQIVNRLEEG